MADNPAELLFGSRQKSWHIFKGENWNVERVAETDEPSGLRRTGDVEAARQDGWLIRHDADGSAVHAGEADDDVLGKVLLDFEKDGAVYDSMNDIADIV